MCGGQQQRWQQWQGYPLWTTYHFWEKGVPPLTKFGIRGYPLFPNLGQNGNPFFPNLGQNGKLTYFLYVKYIFDWLSENDKTGYWLSDEDKTGYSQCKSSLRPRRTPFGHFLHGRV